MFVFPVGFLPSCGVVSIAYRQEHCDYFYVLYLIDERDFVACAAMMLVYKTISDIRNAEYGSGLEYSEELLTYTLGQYFH